MALIKSVRGHLPQFGKGCWLADNASLIGDIICGDNCTFWFQSVVRGDVASIRIGDEVNIQDGVIIHGTFEKADTTIGDQVSIGHRAIIHGCTVGSRVLIGMGAIVMDHALIQDQVIVGAGSLVLENSVLESGFVYAGSPVRKIKAIDPKQFEFFVTRTARNYQMYASWFE